MGLDRETFKTHCSEVKDSFSFFNSMSAGMAAVKTVDQQGNPLSKDAVNKKRFSALKFLYIQNKVNIQNHFKSIMDGPGSGDKDKVLDWISENKDLLSLLESEAMGSYFNDPEDLESAEYQKMRKDTAGVRAFIKDVLEYYDKYSDVVFAENGDELNLDNAQPGSKEAEAKKARDIIRSKIESWDKVKAATAEARKDRDNRIENAVADLSTYAKALKSASKHDKEDYKELIAMVSGFASEDKFRFIKDGKPAAGTENLTDDQREALPFLMIKNKINAYLAHKAKDGVNRNAYLKLAAVEKLNVYVSKKIKVLHPGDFTFNGVSYKESEVHETYKEELAAERAKRSDNILVDSSLNSGVREMGTGLSGDDLKLYKTVSNCMNRIMLKAQVDNIPKALEAVAANKRPEMIPKHLKDAEASFISNPVKFKAAAKAENKAPEVNVNTL